MSKKILLADDSITIQKVVRITLADGDYELITVDNGDEAMAKARELRPDIVMADVVMPGKDGYQVCQEIKSDPDLKDIPVLLLAGSFEGFDEMKGARLGADGYILKPFESQSLVNKVQELLSRPRPARAPAAAPPPPPPAAPPAPEPPAFVKPAPEDIYSLTPEPAPAAVQEPEAVSFVEEPPAMAADDIFSQDFQQPVAEPPAAAGVVDDLWAQTADEVPAAIIEPEPVSPAQPVQQDAWGTMPDLEPTSHFAEPGGAVPEIEAIPEALTSPGEFVSEPQAVPFAESTLPEAHPVAEPVFGEPVAEGFPVEEAPLEAEVEAIPEAEAYAEPDVFSAPPLAESIPEAEPFAEAEPVAEAEAIPEGEAFGDIEAVPEAETFIEPEPVAVPEPVAPPAPKPPPPAAVKPPPPAPAPSPAAPAEVEKPIVRAAEEVATAAASGLKPDQLRAIILETIEAVAWEVVPTLAEVMIEERLNKWEKEKG